MNPPSNVMPDLVEARPTAPAAPLAPRPLYWSLRRELWENRSIYIAPLAVAAVVLLGFLVSLITLRHRMRVLSAAEPALQRAGIAMPYNVAAGLLAVTAFLVGVFYCLDALYGERRDRSILFWKSLPVSDRTTVLAKAGIPLVVLPVFVFVVVVTTQMIMLLLSTLALLGDRPSLALMWARLPLFQLQLSLLYALIVIALWHAPIYGWLLLVSGWARRATFLWAVLPPLAICVFEWLAFRTRHFAFLLQYRLAGWFQQAFSHQAQRSATADPLAHLTPGRFLSSPTLWIGLALAAAFLFAAVRQRRYREPI